MTTFLVAQFLIAGALSAGAAQALQTPPEVDVTEALALAERGDPSAQCRLGTYYSEGPAETRDFVKARQWFKKAADQGYADGQRGLGRLYDSLDPDAHDAEQAARWYALAADQESHRAGD